MSVCAARGGQMVPLNSFLFEALEKNMKHGVY
jgi:hypothetical protein